MKSIIPDSFFIESLGCAKNSVDSRAMAALLTAAGFHEQTDPRNSEVIIVNTCGFIQPARQESLQILCEFAHIKKDNQLLIAAGCLSEREKHLLSNQVPNLDAVFGTRSWSDVLKVIKQAKQNPKPPYLHFPETPRIQNIAGEVPLTAVQGGSAYLKIADGCDRACAFCTIPHIKGPMVSRPLDAVLKDAVMLQQLDVQEVILIAQDTTSYGRDLGYSDGLAVLLKSLVKAAPHIPWLRVMYAFPGAVTDELIRVMAGEPQILPYLDLPLQHAHPNILKRMMRPDNIELVKRLIQKMRMLQPDLALRSTFIVGFPGESGKEFDTLKEFLRELRFDRVGFFPFYQEEFTHAYEYSDLVTEDVKKERLHQLAAIQQEISLKKNQTLFGREMDVLIEGQGKGVSIGRSYRDAPEIDGLVIVKGNLPIGQLVKVMITEALVYDLMARPI